MSVVIHLPFAEDIDEILPSDVAGGLEDLNGDPLAPLLLPAIVETPVGLARQFGDGVGLVGVEAIDGAGRLTQDLTIEAVISFDPAELTEPAVIVQRGDGSSAAERILWGLMIEPESATHARVFLRWQTATGAEGLVPGVSFRVPSGPFYLWAVRRWVSRSEVEVRYGVGDLQLAAGVSTDGQIEDGDGGIVQVGCERSEVFQALHLDRSLSQYATITDAEQTGLDVTGALTIEARVRFASLGPGTTQIIVGKLSASNNEINYQLTKWEDDALRLLVGDGDGGSGNLYHLRTAPGVITDNDWHRLAFRFDPAIPGDMADAAAIFVDGVKMPPGDHTGKPAGALHNSNEPFWISFNHPLLALDGDIRDVKVWGRALSDAEIAQGTALTTELRGEFLLDGDFEGSSGNGNVLTPVNGPTFIDGTTYSSFFPGSIAVLRVRDSETSLEQLRQIYRAIAVHGPNGYAAHRQLAPGSFPSDPETITQRELAVEGGALGTVAAELAATVEDGLPDRASGDMLKRWEKVEQLAPRPRDSIATRRKRAAGRWASIHGFNVDKVPAALAPMLDCQAEDLEIIEGTNRYSDDFATLKNGWDQHAGAGAISAAGQLVLDAQSAVAPWPFDAVYVSRPIDRSPTRAGGHIGVYLKATLAGIADFDGFNSASAGLLLYDSSSPTLDALLFGYDEATRLRLWSLTEADGRTIEHTFAEPAAVLPRVLHASIGDGVITFGTADPAAPNTLEESLDFATALVPSWLGFALVVETFDAGAPAAQFDDAAWLFRNGESPFYWYVFRNPALGGAPDLLGARAEIAKIKPAHTSGFVTESESAIASDTVVGGGVPVGE